MVINLIDFKKNYNCIFLQTNKRNDLNSVSISSEFEFRSLDGRRFEADIFKEIVDALQSVQITPENILTSKGKNRLERDDSGFDESPSNSPQLSLNSSKGNFLQNFWFWKILEAFVSEYYNSRIEKKLLEVLMMILMEKSSQTK